MALPVWGSFSQAVNPTPYRKLPFDTEIPFWTKVVRESGATAD